MFFHVVTDMSSSANVNGALGWLIGEMDRRYAAFAKADAEDVKSYNRYVREKRPEDGAGVPLKGMPRIVVVLDEFADLMMKKDVNVTDCVVRLGQKARAAGIHLILATQRSSAKTMPGEIKANMPGRMALTTASAVDSRIIIECNGAEKLLRNGDMLFTDGGCDLARVQGAFVDKREVFAVTGHIRKNNPAVEYCDPGEVKDGGSAGTGMTGDKDPLFDEVLDYISGFENISIGMLQRKFRIGFNRAARLMEQLYEAGAVGEDKGKVPR